MRELLTALGAVLIGTATTMFLFKNDIVDFNLAGIIGITVMISVVFAPYIFISTLKNTGRKPD